MVLPSSLKFVRDSYPEIPHEGSHWMLWISCGEIELL